MARGHVEPSPQVDCLYGTMEDKVLDVSNPTLARVVERSMCKWDVDRLIDVLTRYRRRYNV